MFEEFTVPAYLHDSVFYDMVEKGYIPMEINDPVPTSFEDEDVPF